MSFSTSRFACVRIFVPAVVGRAFIVAVFSGKSRATNGLDKMIEWRMKNCFVNGYSHRTRLHHFDQINVENVSILLTELIRMVSDCTCIVFDRERGRRHN